MHEVDTTRARRTVAVNRARVEWTKTQAKRIAALAAEQDKLDELCKLVERQTKVRDRAIRQANDAGVTHAEMGRILGVTKARVWQILRAMGAIASKAGSPKAAAAEDQGGADEAGADDA